MDKEMEREREEEREGRERGGRELSYLSLAMVTLEFHDDDLNENGRRDADDIGYHIRTGGGYGTAGAWP